jgi:hypothetical protein
MRQQNTHFYIKLALGKMKATPFEYEDRNYFIKPEYMFISTIARIFLI